ncbi:MAG TPA: Ig-like domain-containing protein [Actinomycetota bacterium]|nr:Ig-like domain-containing protein [Actinomycetota bacterium]
MTRALGRGLAATGLAGALIAGVPAVPAVAQPAPESARNIRLCHGDTTSPCETGSQAEGGGGHHDVTVAVTDAAGAPVPDVPVQLREEGEGRFTTGGDSVVVVTGADGRATAVVTSDVVGRSLVWAEISPPGTPGGFRGPATDDDACEQPSDADGVPGPGNCIAGPLSVDWHVPPPPPECSDRQDNDQDGYVDADDPSCAGEFDDSEDGPVDVRYNRKVTLAFSEWKRGRLLAFGRVKLEGAGPAECVEGVPVRIVRRSRGGWVHVATVSTGGSGWYLAVVADTPGRYRASALRYETMPPSGEFTTCRRASRAKTHRHRS